MTGKARAGIIRFMVVFMLLMRFFRRTLIQYGALRSGMVRWSLTALAAAWMVFSCVVAYFFLRPLGADRTIGIHRNCNSGCRKHSDCCQSDSIQSVYLICYKNTDTDQDQRDCC